jgi:biotin carboxylase
VFPTQEQVTVLSHQLPRLSAAGLCTAVPPFDALRRVQDKVAARATLDEAGVAQPQSMVVCDPSSLDGWRRFPAFVKSPVGTASSGVLRADGRGRLVEAVQVYLDRGAGLDGGVLVQEAADGPLVMAQSIFAAGTLVAFHANERVCEGVNGSASVKQSIDLPPLRTALERLGNRLQWHGALSVDAIVTDRGPLVIDVNPRLVEPGNAAAAGTDLVATLLAVATGTPLPEVSEPQAGVRTHQLLMAILGEAQRTGRRRTVMGEVAAGLSHRGAYAGSREELLPPRGDWRTLSLPVAAAMATLIRPSSYRWFTDGAVAGYALSPAGWRALCESAPGGITPRES